MLETLALSLELPKNTTYMRSHSGRPDTAHLIHLWCTAPVTNCRKNNLAPLFVGIGRYSILCVDVNNAAQIRQEGAPPSIPFTFHLARWALCLHAHVRIEHISLCAFRPHYVCHQVLLCNKVGLNVILLPDPLLLEALVNLSTRLPRSAILILIRSEKQPHFSTNLKMTEIPHILWYILSVLAIPYISTM